MKPKSPLLLVVGGLLFFVGAALLVIWLSGGSPLLLGMGLASVALSAAVLAVGGRWVTRRKDPLEARKERRLWSSGPLGRGWLERRNRLP